MQFAPNELTSTETSWALKYGFLTNKVEFVMYIIRLIITVVLNIMTHVFPGPRVSNVIEKPH